MSDRGKRGAGIGVLGRASPGALLSAAAHAAIVGLAAYAPPWMERREGAEVRVTEVRFVTEAELAAPRSRGLPDAAPPPERQAPPRPPDAPAPEPDAPAPPPEPPSAPEPTPSAPAPAAPASDAPAPPPEAPPPPAPAEVPPGSEAPPADRAALRPLPRPEPPAEPRPPVSPGEGGKAAEPGPGGRAGGGPGAETLRTALGEAVRAKLLRTQGFVARARARARGTTRDPLLQVTIARDGRLADARLLRSSGDTAVDAATLRAAQAAAPYPAAPDALPGSRFAFQVQLVAAP